MCVLKRNLKVIVAIFLFIQERPKWMKITSLDELKTKVGHVIVMILLVKMFGRSKMVKIAKLGYDPFFRGTGKSALPHLD